MTPVRRFALLLVAAVAIGPMACAPRRALAPRPWDAYASEGRLRVHGEPADAPGPRIYRALANREDLDDLFERQGEPDALEVIGRGRQTQRIVVFYWRRGVGRPRRIVLDATRSGFVASAPQPLTRARKTVRSERQPGGEAETDASADRGGDPQTDASRWPDRASGPQPSATQRFECPIDRARPDCRAYCDGGASYEWCR